MDRRLKAISCKNARSQQSFINLGVGACACIMGRNYNLTVGFLDTCAIQGAISFEKVLALCRKRSTSIFDNN